MGPIKAEDKVREVRREQEYFDLAMDAHLDKWHRYESELSSPGTAVDRRAMKKTVDQMHRLSGEDAAALMRVDLDDGDTYYLGKTSIRNDDGFLVFNWKERAGSTFYQATPDDPRGVRRKRTYATDGNRIKDFQDAVLEHIAQDIRDLDGYVGSDDPILTSLEARRTGELKDIVGTIQAAQDKILRTKKDTLLVVQGGPGTGKTVVALHRASWILYNYRDEIEPEDMLVVGPNPAFTKYIQKVLPDLGDHSVRQTSIQGMLQRSIAVRAIEPDNVARIKGSSRMQDVIASGLNDRIKAPSGPIRIRRRNSASAITLLAHVVAEDIEEFRAQYYGAGRDMMRTRLMERCAEQLGRRGGASAEDIVDPRSLDAELNKLWPQLSAAQFVRELLGSKQRLRAAASEDLNPEEIELLHRAAAERIADEPWTLADVALIDEAASFMQDRQELWGHIVVDEAQDLTPMQLAALRRRSRNGSMTIVGDLAQSTGPFARDSWDDIIGDLRSNAEVVTAELEYGYRVPRQVFTVAEPVLQAAAPELTPPTIVRDVRDEPTLFDVSPNMLSGEVARLASHHSGKGRFVGVIAPSQMWEDIVTAFDEADLQWNDSTQGGLGSSINLVTPEASKGLEFEAVIVVDPRTILDQDHGERLLYIAMTRTTNRLEVVVPSGDVPELLSDVFTNVKVIEDAEVAKDVQHGDPEQSRASPDGQRQGTLAGGMEDAEASGMNVQTEGPIAAPTPREMVNSTRSLHSAGGLATGHTTVETSSENGGLSAVQRELVRQNAQYLVRIIVESFGPALRGPVMKEALAILLEQRSAPVDELPLAHENLDPSE